MKFRSVQEGKRKKEEVSAGLCREVYVFFLDRLPSCMHCKPVRFLYQVCKVFFRLCNKSSCGIAADTLCSTLFGNPYNCRNG